jgi:uncharacterized delta-60 repeat protein
MWSVSGFSQLNGASGDLDPSFGAGGKVTTVLGSDVSAGQSVVGQNDGKILVAGSSHNGANYDFALVRYTTAGALDTSFNGTGKVTTPISNDHDLGSAVAVQGDGKILVAGSSFIGGYINFALARYTNGGALDTALNGSGKVTTHFSGSDRAHSTAVQSDGKILVAGFSYNGIRYNFALVRYTSTGALDTSFNGTGKVTTPVGPNHDEAYSVAVQGDGKILVAGTSYNGSNYDFALVRYTSAGALDTSFNGTGKVTTPIGSSADIGSAVLVQSDGRIILAGSYYNGSNYDFALARYMSTGALDTSFGGGLGTVTTPIGSGNDYGKSGILRSDGKIIVAGEFYNGSNYDFAVVRYTSTGALDNSFGSGGKVNTPVGSSDDRGRGVALQSDGRVVVAGTSHNGSYDNFALVRYLGDDATGHFSWPSNNGYAHPLSKSDSAIRSPTAAQFLSPGYVTNHARKHVGMDLEKSDGSTADRDVVCAIDDGQIMFFRRQLVGDGFYPVIFVRHYTAAGQAFWAIYGHCNLLDSIRPRPDGMPDSDEEEVALDGSPITITKGKPIGKIITANNEPHLHFGINFSASRSEFFVGAYGWGRIPPTTTDAYVYDTLKWKVPINQDSPVLLGWLNDPANTNNAPEQYSNWQTRAFAGTAVPPASQAPTADADGDGIRNQDEYGLGLDPLSGANAGQPKVELIQSGGFTFPGFKHLRRRNATDLLYSVLASDDLVTWEPGGTLVVQFGLPEPAPDGDSEIVTFRLSPYGPAAQKKFFSVSVSPAP